MSNSDILFQPSGLKTSPVPLDLCGMAEAAKLVGDSWTLLILRDVQYGVTRFDDLREDLGISSATLSDRCTRLIDLGMLEKRSYREGNARPRAEYVLTDAGHAFGPVLFAMMEWADRHLAKEDSPLRLIDPETGNALHIALADKSGRVTDWSKAIPVISEAGAKHR